MPDRIPSCRGAGCCQGDKPEACDCGQPVVVIKEFPSFDNLPTWAISVALVTLAIALSSLLPMGFAR